MTETFLTILVWKVGSSLLIDLTKRGLKRISEAPFFLSAVVATAENFPDFDNLHHLLKTFCDSDRFLNLLERLKSGERDLTDDILVSAFIETTGFYNGDTTHQSASEILHFFFQRLELSLYRSIDALPSIAARQETLHDVTRAVVRQSSDVLSSQMASFQAAVLARLTPDEGVSSENPQERIWDSEINTARNLLNRGKSKTARVLLSDIRRRLSEAVPLRILVRIAINLGICALREGELDKAEKEFDLALKLQPHDPKALANRAQVGLLSGTFDLALELAKKARIQKPNESYSTVLCILALSKLGKSKEIEELLSDEPWIKEDAQCRLVLAELAWESGNYTEAENLLQKCKQLDPDNPHVWELSGRTGIEPIQKELQANPPPVAVPDGDHPKVPRHRRGLYKSDQSLSRE